LLKLELKGKKVNLEALKDGKTHPVGGMDKREHNVLREELLGVRSLRLFLALDGQEFLRAL
jgi:hypothetical protein